MTDENENVDYIQDKKGIDISPFWKNRGLEDSVDRVYDIVINDLLENKGTADIMKHIIDNDELGDEDKKIGMAAMQGMAMLMKMAKLAAESDIKTSQKRDVKDMLEKFMGGGNG